MMAAKKSVSTKRKKKAWYGLYAPSSLNNAFLGESYVYGPDELVGKSIKLNLSMITNDMKKQNVLVSFRVNKVEDNKGLADLIGYSLSLSYLKRLVRRRRDKIDDSFVAKDKEGKFVRIKTVAMTNSKTYESASSAIRLSLRAKIRKSLKEMSFEEFVNALINIRLQRDWKTSLSKIYPLKFLEVRHASLVVLKKNVEDEEDKDFTELVKEEDIDLDYAEESDESDEVDASETDDVDEDVEESDEEVDDDFDEKLNKESDESVKK